MDTSRTSRRWCPRSAGPTRRAHSPKRPGSPGAAERDGGLNYAAQSGTWHIWNGWCHAPDISEAAGKLAEGKFLYQMVLSDDSVKFPTDSAELSPEAQTRLNDFVQKLKAENKNVYLEIQGHTDAKGSKTTNMRLGEERAEGAKPNAGVQKWAGGRLVVLGWERVGPRLP